MLGKVINGYKIEDFLGKGGFGEVYKASKDGKDYAIKFIRTDFIYPTELERLSREVSALKRVESELTVKYYEDGDHVENFTSYRYIVMELVEGPTLREYLDSNKGPLDEDQAIELTLKLLKGLSAIHSKNVIHRDFKPENIKIVNSQKIKILDYGLSKIIDYSSITQTGAVIGTYYYMSPEQIKGEKPLAPGSDFYSLGVILYELLTGSILFYPSSDAQIVYKTVHVKPPYPSTLNPKISNNIENTLLKLLEKEVYKRFRTIDELIKELTKKISTSIPSKEVRLKFYPRLIQNDTSIIETFLKTESIDGADFPINLHTQYKSITNLLKREADKIDFFADPGTNRMVYTNFRKTKGLKALPYAPTGFDPLEVEDFETTESIKKFVKSVIDLQIANGCSVLTAPFFYFDNTTDEWFVINIKMLREGIEYVRSSYPQYKISGAVCTQAETLCRRKERQTIIEDYGHCEMDFCQFYIDRIDENIVDAQLYNFILTALAIKNFNKCKIVACRTPGVALGLLTVGFDAITSGLGVLESFDKGVIVKEEDDVRMPTRFYFPDIILSVPMNSGTGIYKDILTQEMRLKSDFPKMSFNLSCNCIGCKNQEMSTNFQLPRLHFLHARNKEVADINAMDPNNRKKYFFSRLEKAYMLQQKLIEYGIKLRSPGYLLTWKEILGKY